MRKNINQILVVGGGTAGWLTASILAKKLDIKNNPDLDIALVESPNIPTIGVGEGTVPTMRETLKLIGISESEFIKECDATFKQSVEFRGWQYNPKEMKQDHYHHLFNYPLTPGFDLSPYWLNSNREMSFAQSVSVQSYLCENNRAPKKITHPEFQGVVDYAYHLNAGKFAQLLTKNAVNNLGVKHLKATVTEVNLSNTEYIESVTTQELGRLEADFFIDCTGFSSLLLGQALQVPFIDKSDVLFVDTALAVQVPYKNSDDEIATHTIATAQEAGWIWDIGLSTRRGVGYVYSSKHTSESDADLCLRRYLNDHNNEMEFRKISMKVGYRESFCYKNCAAIGLSGGFVEPLEATALMFVEATAKLLADLFPRDFDSMDIVAKKLNESVNYGWERIVEFIKLHYLLSKRDDTQFWLDNRHQAGIPIPLLERLSHWQSQPPSAHDFPSRFEVFGLENYQYILFGMNYKIDLSNNNHIYPNAVQAEQAYKKLLSIAVDLTDTMPTHRELIESIKLYGMQKK